MQNRTLKREQLYKHQVASADLIVNNYSAAIFADMGTGKTASTLTAIHDLIFDYLEVQHVLVISTKKIAETVWHNEIKTWEHTKKITYSRVIGTAKQREKALEKNAMIYIIGRDNVKWLCNYVDNLSKFDMIVLDESTSFKNPDSQRFKYLRKYIKYIKRRVILTGTPRPNNISDLWSQVFLLDNGMRLERTITEFRKKYLTSNSYGGFTKYEEREGAKEQIYNRLSDISIVLKGSDYLDLPAVTIIDRWVTLPKKAMSEYKTLLKNYVTYLEETEISAINAAVLTNKLTQFANGRVYDDNKDVKVVHNSKLDMFNEIVEASNSPVFVAYNFISDKDAMIESLEKRKVNYRILKNDKDVQDWNTGKIDVMLAHPASAGHGLNLQFGGYTLIWYGLTWSLELYQQMNARLNRPGQKHPVMIYRILTENTIDIRMLYTIERKDNNQNDMLNILKEIIHEYNNK